LASPFPEEAGELQSGSPLSIIPSWSVTCKHFSSLSEFNIALTNASCGVRLLSNTLVTTSFVLFKYIPPRFLKENVCHACMVCALAKAEKFPSQSQLTVRRFLRPALQNKSPARYKFILLAIRHFEMT